MKSQEIIHVKIYHSASLIVCKVVCPKNRTPVVILYLGMMSQSQAMHSMNPMHGHVMNGHMVNMQQQMSQNPMNPQMMTQMMPQQMNQVQMPQQQTQQPQQTVLLVSNLDPEVNIKWGASSR